jgi:hypothetical protein
VFVPIDIIAGVICGRAGEAAATAASPARAWLDVGALGAVVLAPAFGLLFDADGSVVEFVGLESVIDRAEAQNILMHRAHFRRHKCHSASDALRRRESRYWQ